MLIEFRVANYRSIKEKQVFSLVASKHNALIDSHTFKAKGFKDRLLRSTAVYGPNASGKTSLLRALRSMKAIVKKSARESHRGDILPIEPFKLDSGSREVPTEFEVVFIAEGVRYQYGFSATEERVVSEWLLAFPEGRPQHWFERELSKNTYRWSFGPALKGEKQLWQKSTRDNALFLSTAVHITSQQLQPVYDWFNNTLRLFFGPILRPDSSASFCEKNGNEMVVDFLKEADLDIHNVHAMKGGKLYKIKTVHESSSGEPVEFDLGNESDGTQKIFSLAGPFLDSRHNGRVVCIDGLHDNLHPELVKFLVGLFNNTKTNPGNAQLIFTTHATSMLNEKILHRDQIWFCEKDKNQATTFYPLSDFRPREGVENLERAYLSGRYGALPWIPALH